MVYDLLKTIKSSKCSKSSVGVIIPCRQSLEVGGLLLGWFLGLWLDVLQRDLVLQTARTRTALDTRLALGLPQPVTENK